MTSPTLRLNGIIAPVIEQLGYEFVTSELLPQGGYTLLRIYIDSPKGVTVEDCEVVSRQVSAVLDVENPISGQYNLEVSSPGFYRPLVTSAHFARFVGHHIKVKLRQSRDEHERRNYSGLLQAVSEGNIIIIVDGDPCVLPLSDIEKANLIPDS
jgi:ribosome maturation factor RimP